MRVCRAAATYQTRPRRGAVETRLGFSSGAKPKHSKKYTFRSARGAVIISPALRAQLCTLCVLHLPSQQSRSRQRQVKSSKSPPDGERDLSPVIIYLYSHCTLTCPCRIHSFTPKWVTMLALRKMSSETTLHFSSKASCAWCSLTMAGCLLQRS